MFTSKHSACVDSSWMTWQSLTKDRLVLEETKNARFILSFTPIKFQANFSHLHLCSFQFPSTGYFKNKKKSLWNTGPVNQAIRYQSVAVAAKISHPPAGCSIRLWFPSVVAAAAAPPVVPVILQLLQCRVNVKAVRRSLGMGPDSMDWL